MNYNFSSINDKDLEDLTRDLLSKELKVNFQTFKRGKDKGIDLRYSTNDNENEIIIQVKHYTNSKYSNLKSDLKNKELPKVEKLNPKRYIVVTSLPLSLGNKEEIKKVLSPFVSCTGDIYGQDELNGLLIKYPEIEESHFKLWLSSTTVLKRILNNALKGRSEFAVKNIENRIKKFVPSKNHQNSVEILNNKNFILITGAPGIGKTVLANILTYQLLAEDFELVYINEIREAEDAFQNNKKQVFYFDDFLGTITLDLTSSRNADATLINFIERIKNDNQKRLILTCRTTILNQAKEKSEKIDNSKIDISNHEVKIEDYGKLEKAKILYNHIYYSNLTDELKSIFFKDEFYWKIINHKNYNPRIIEFFTDIESRQNDLEYKKEVISYLDNPDKIWEKSFTIQLSENARIMLSTLFSISGRYVVNENSLKDAFKSRIDFEIAKNNFRKKSNLFNRTIKELQNAFIYRTVKIYSEYYKSTEIRFLNPSVEDFLYYYFNENIDEYFTVLESSIYIEQFKARITTRKKPWEKKIYFSSSNYNRLLKLFLDKFPNLESYSTNKDLDTVFCLINLFKWIDIGDIVINILKNTRTIDLDYNDKFNLIEIMEYFGENKLTELLPISLDELFINITEGSDSFFLLTHSLPGLLNYDVYKETINEMKKKELSSFKKYSNNIILFWEQNIEKYILESNITKAQNKDEIEAIVEYKVNEAIKLTEQLQVDDLVKLRKFKFNSERQLNDNIKAQQSKKIEIENIKQKELVSNEISEVNRLFENDNETDKIDVPF